jgi:hypothetical protein
MEKDGLRGHELPTSSILTAPEYEGTTSNGESKHNKEPR